MRLAILTPYLSRRGGGLFSAVHALACALSEHTSIKVGIFGFADEDASSDLQQWNAVEVAVFRGGFLQSLQCVPGMAAAIGSYRPDLIHTHGLWSALSLVGLLTDRNLKVPRIVSPHGMLDGWALRQSRLKKMLGAALFENSNLQSARCLHATAWAELEAIRHYGLKNPVCMVPNAVEIPKLDGKPWRNRGGGKAVLVYLGRFHRKKGLENLLQGWALARKKYGNRAENWRLRIAGGDQGKYHTKLQEIVDRIGVTESVELLAPKFGLEKRDFLENADGLILPSQSEGLPMIVIEAWAHSLPTLITRHCNLPEGALAGAAIEVGTDPESLCHGIASFMEMSPQQRNAMGESARRLAQTRFGGATVATAMKDVYMWAVGGSTCPTSVYLH